MTPMISTRANAGFSTAAVIAQRRPRQNHDAVASASSPAAVTGEVATRTANTASRKMFSSRKPRPAGITANTATIPRTTARVVASSWLASAPADSARACGDTGSRALRSGRRGWGRG